VLTCDCGACFEVRDAQPGQPVSCPECHHPVKVSARVALPPRTSGLALASLTLALVGAFTIVGTLAAILVGLLAFVHVLHQPDRFKGLGLASAGIALGALFTALTVGFVWSGGLGLAGKMREVSMASLLDPNANPNDDLKYRDCSLTLPSDEWRKVRQNRSDDPAVYEFQRDRDLVLLNPRRHAYLDVHIDNKFSNENELANYKRHLLDDLRPARAARGEDLPLDEGHQAPAPTVLSTRGIPSPQFALQGQEFLIDVRGGGQTWRYVVWVYRRNGPERLDPKRPVPVYVVRGYTPARYWEQNKDELYAALESFRVGSER
jgi:hypothetical protein